MNYRYALYAIFFVVSIHYLFVDCGNTRHQTEKTEPNCVVFYFWTKGLVFIFETPNFFDTE
jgi:hypothetical protein